MGMGGMHNVTQFFVAGNATLKSPCQLVCHTLFFFVFLSCLKVEKFRYKYFMDVNAPAQILTAPTQLITAPAQPLATEVVVYTALVI